MKDWICHSCKKEIHTEVVKCVPCMKNFHPGCSTKHKVWSNSEMVSCTGRRECIRRNKENEKGETAETNRTEKAGKIRKADGGKVIDQRNTTVKTVVKEIEKETEKQQIKIKDRAMEDSIEKILKIVRGMKDDSIGRNEIKKIVNEAVAEEVGGLRREIEQLRRAISEISRTQSNESRGVTKSYVEAVRAGKAESILIVKPKEQQESEATKNTVIEKVKINTLPIGVSRMTKGNNGTIIIGCESGKEIKRLKTSVDATIGKEFEMIIPKQKQPKIKITGIDKEEMELNDQSLIETIKVQNELTEKSEGLHLRIVKRGSIGKRNERKTKKEEVGYLIIEMDAEIHKKLISKGKVNLGWRKCRVYDFVSILRCFKS